MTTICSLFSLLVRMTSIVTVLHIYNKETPRDEAPVLCDIVSVSSNVTTHKRFCLFWRGYPPVRASCVITLEKVSPVGQKLTKVARNCHVTRIMMLSSLFLLLSTYKTVAICGTRWQLYGSPVSVNIRFQRLDDVNILLCRVMNGVYFLISVNISYFKRHLMVWIYCYIVV